MVVCSGRFPGRGEQLPEIPWRVSDELSDLLTLTALACQVPAAILASFTTTGDSRITGFGLSDEVAATASSLLSEVAAGAGPVESNEVVSISPLVAASTGNEPLRWAYGEALRRPNGTVLAIVVLLDRHRRQPGSRENVAIGAFMRRILNALEFRLDDQVARPVIDLTAEAKKPRPGQGSDTEVIRSVDVARIFAVSDRTVMKWASEGRIPSFRTAGGRLRFRRRDITAFIEHQKVFAGPDR